MNVCPNYCGIACVDGSCPKANYEEYLERGYDVVRNCEECIYYKGCEDCCFNNTNECPVENITKKFIKALKNVLIELLIEENIMG